jgi:hypothetical protein
MYRFLLFGVRQYVASPITPFHYVTNCADGLSVFIPAYAAASAFVACCVSTIIVSELTGISLWWEENKTQYTAPIHNRMHSLKIKE